MTDPIRAGNFVVSGDNKTGKLHLEGQEEVREFTDKYFARQHVAELYIDDEITNGLFDKLAAQIADSSLPDSQDHRHKTSSASKGSVADNLTSQEAQEILRHLDETVDEDNTRRP